MLPGQSGLALARQLARPTRARSELPIIMLTARADEARQVAGLDARRRRLLTKPFSPRELLARIRPCCAGARRRPLDDAVEVGGARARSGDAPRHAATARALKLGPTEFRLLHFFMTHPERVHSRAQLLDQVWGDHVFIEERTVDVHIRRLREALEPPGSTR